MLFYSDSEGFFLFSIKLRNSTGMEVRDTPTSELRREFALFATRNPVKAPCKTTFYLINSSLMAAIASALLAFALSSSNVVGQAARSVLTTSLCNG